MRCLFLYHGGSGRGRVGKRLGYIKRRLHRNYEVVDAVKTASAEELMARVKQGLKEYDAVIFSGGEYDPARVSSHGHGQRRRTLAQNSEELKWRSRRHPERADGEARLHEGGKQTRHVYRRGGGAHERHL